MISDSGRFYLYRHIRLDKNVPFYIGIAKKRKGESFKAIYGRAFEFKSKRSDFWKRIIAMCDYRVEILLESDDFTFIKQKEIEFVSLYGRKNLGKGTLCNLTNGGDGCNEYIPTEEDILNREKGNLLRCKSIIMMDMNGEYIKEFNSVTECANELKVTTNNVSGVCKIAKNSKNGSVNRTVRNYIVCYKEDFSKFIYYVDKTDSIKRLLTSLKKNNLQSRKPVYQYDKLGNLIKRHESGVDGDKSLGLPVGSCSTVASKNNIKEIMGSIGGYYWFYQEVDFNKFTRIRHKNGIKSLRVNK